MITLRIREVAEAQGMTPAYLARRSGLAESTIRRYWQDPRQNIRTDTLNLLAHTLQVDVSALIDYTPESARQLHDAIFSATVEQECPCFGKDDI